MKTIEVKNLSKQYLIAKRQEGMWGAVRSLFHREYITKTAVEDVSFSIEEGEVVGYIGPNGAGKSTTIKMLTGILVPTSGEVHVGGLVPYQERQKNARQIGVVFGQRSQLWWDLPTIESFELLKQVYHVSDQQYRKNMNMFTEILGLDEFFQTPVRQLSLGQRMRADIAASLLHDPSILFLDEPTIGLDVVAKERMRTFIQEMNNERGITVILTTHDMSDIEKLCKRMILIDRGRVMYDGALETIKEHFGTSRILIVDVEQNTSLHIEGVELIREEGKRKWLRFNRQEYTAAQLIQRISERTEIVDISLQEPEIDSIIRQMYERGEYL
ncbi:ABC transporter ATP-binding protein [Aneurinibacillus uraniidurans]|uniref:ABC transporter ATP-binding protein n=1 Tax=Aneurinibacillus uraniidurans TaxID=2966586 RepID=UPI002349C5F4|nr:ATP-binding cassette domain-containing protein [Aneurinibacillus sp. B1]WCN39551.1 ATP-binding cassette domain-containing protein [Aneurinibacillus sp. B1]